MTPATSTKLSETPEFEYVDVLLPGFIEASNHIQWGEPCLKGTRIPYHVGLGWVWESLNSKRDRKLEGLTRENIIALAAFHAGYEWHKSRKRRQTMVEATRRLWQQIALEAEAGTR